MTNINLEPMPLQTTLKPVEYIYPFLMGDYILITETATGYQSFINLYKYKNNELVLLDKQRLMELEAFNVKYLQTKEKNIYVAFTLPRLNNNGLIKTIRIEEDKIVFGRPEVISGHKTQITIKELLSVNNKDYIIYSDQDGQLNYNELNDSFDCYNYKIFRTNKSLDYKIKYMSISDIILEYGYNYNNKCMGINFYKGFDNNDEAPRVLYCYNLEDKHVSNGGLIHAQDKLIALTNKTGKGVISFLKFYKDFADLEEELNIPGHKVFEIMGDYDDKNNRVIVAYDKSICFGDKSEDDIKTLSYKINDIDVLLISLPRSSTLMKVIKNHIFYIDHNDEPKALIV